MRCIYDACFWCAAVALVALVIVSLGYTFVHALFISSALIPGAVILPFLLHKVSVDDSIHKMANGSFIILSVLIFEITIIFTVCFYLNGGYSEPFTVASILINPFFIGIIWTAIVCSHHLLKQYITQRSDSKPHQIVFTSNYKKITVDITEIQFVESRDKDVIINLTNNKSYKNGISISQWEKNLGNQFLRIHRSFLVNKNSIKEIKTNSVVTKSGTELPMSRSYKDQVKASKL